MSQNRNVYGTLVFSSFNKVIHRVGNGQLWSQQTKSSQNMELDCVPFDVRGNLQTKVSIKIHLRSPGRRGHLPGCPTSKMKVKNFNQNFFAQIIAQDFSKFQVVSNESFTSSSLASLCFQWPACSAGIFHFSSSIFAHPTFLSTHFFGGLADVVAATCTATG